MSNLREAQKQLTRRLLLDSGLATFEAKGYAATTIDDIASGAGTTRTTFYLHFPSKAELMKAIITDLDEILVRSDDPPLTDVVASGDPRLVREWLVRKIDQWSEIGRGVTAAHEAAASDKDIAKAVDQWFESAIADIHAGLDKAGRFEPGTRHVRGALAFGQLEFLSRRWFADGWTETVDRETSVDLLTSSWVHLLCA